MQEKNVLNKEQKIGFVLLFVFAILVVGLGFMQIKRNIYGPFAISVNEEGDSENVLDYDENTKLQQIDTDHDGLNDYDELYFYETSPYLPDTDSDGVEDKVEIDQGEDPNCPIGLDCSTGSSIINGSSAEFSSSSVDLSPIGGGHVITPADLLVKSQLGEGNENGIDMNEILNDPDYLRTILLSTGQISEEELANIDDETLLVLASQLAEDEYDFSLENLEQ